MQKTKHIVYLGCSGFPYGLAEIQKIVLISKSLICHGNRVTVVNRNGFHNKADHPTLTASGNFENIDFVYTSKDPFRHDKFISRNLLKIKGAVNEFLFLRKKKRLGELNFAILSTGGGRFYLVLYYWFLSKIFGFKTILNYVEYFPGFKVDRFRIGKKMDYYLYDKYAPRLTDAALPISEFLIDHLKKQMPHIKYLKIPVLTDVEKFDNIEILDGPDYFLFCGATAYKEVILFVIDSFIALNNPSYQLYLVVNGDTEPIQEIKKYVENSAVKCKVKVFSKLPEKELYTYYKNARALLIPLRPTVQDTARFPHKVGEYLASGRPIVSTSYGEIKYYFRDNENMLIADEYDVNLFAQKMQYVIDHPAASQRIGCNGKEVAAKMFDYRAYANPLNEFLNHLEAK